MKNKNKIQEVTLGGGQKSPTIIIPKSKLKQTLSDLKGTSTNIMPVDDSLLGEVDAVIEPQDPETIKYLSNVIDNNTGEISKPFVIGDKQYKMVRGLNQNDEIVLGVFCFDDMDADGNNMIHPVDYFEENVAMPAMMSEKMTMNENDESIGLSEYKHFIVNEKTNKFRKFKTLPELAMASMNEEEKYMTLKEFKKYFEGKIFGKNHVKQQMLEVGLTGSESDEEMNIKAKKLMDMIKKRIPSNIITTIKAPVAKREVIAAFAEMIGVPRNGLAQLISGLKDLSKIKQSTQQAQPDQTTQPIQETRKIIKVKNIK